MFDRALYTTLLTLFLSNFIRLTFEFTYHKKAIKSVNVLYLNQLYQNSNDNVVVLIRAYLTHFAPMFDCYTFWKHRGI